MLDNSDSRVLHEIRDLLRDLLSMCQEAHRYQIKNNNKNSIIHKRILEANIEIMDEESKS